MNTLTKNTKKVYDKLVEKSLSRNNKRICFVYKLEEVTKTGIYYNSIFEEIANELSLTRQTVRKHYNKLKELGYVSNITYYNCLLKEDTSFTYYDEYIRQFHTDIFGRCPLKCHYSNNEYLLEDSAIEILK